MMDREASTGEGNCKGTWRFSETATAVRLCPLTSRPEEELTLYGTQVRARAVDREGHNHNRLPSAMGEQ